jgi:predicted nucleic acid-binding protein
VGSQADPPALLKPRLFLDANVLFAASITPTGRAAALVQLARGGICDLLASLHAAEEARRNLALRYPSHADRLRNVLETVALVPEPSGSLVTWALRQGLPEQDAPILAAAVSAKADALVTGDRTHFGPLFGRTLRGVRVVPLSDALALVGFSGP